MANVTVGARLARIRNGLTPREWARAGAMLLSVIALNVVGWLLLALAVGGHYHITNTEIFGFGTGALAYTLGMRHAFDADHIAAIDNTTRKLVNDGKRPLSVGFFFSLGHSTIVFVMALLLNFGIRALDEQVKNDSSGLHNVTGIIGTTVSGTFLYIIAILNVIILVGILRVFREMRSGQYSDEQFEEQLNKRGLMNRFFWPGPAGTCSRSRPSCHPIAAANQVQSDAERYCSRVVVANEWQQTPALQASEETLWPSTRFPICPMTTRPWSRTSRARSWSSTMTSTTRPT